MCYSDQLSPASQEAEGEGTLRVRCQRLLLEALPKQTTLKLTAFVEHIDGRQALPRCAASLAARLPRACVLPRPVPLARALDLLLSRVVMAARAAL